MIDEVLYIYNTIYHT